MTKKVIPEKWKKETAAIKAVQVAFDVGEEVQHLVRKEAVEMGINPSDRVREILGLPTVRRVQRPRLSISLSPDDFAYLAQEYNIDAEDRIRLKQQAAQKLIKYVQLKTKPS